MKEYLFPVYLVYMPVVPTLWKAGQEEDEFQTTKGYPSVTNNKKTLGASKYSDI